MNDIIKAFASSAVISALDMLRVRMRTTMYKSFWVLGNEEAKVHMRLAGRYLISENQDSGAKSWPTNHQRFRSQQKL
jgi:hypothetical protein